MAFRRPVLISRQFSLIILCFYHIYVAYVEIQEPKLKLFLASKCKWCIKAACSRCFTAPVPVGVDECFVVAICQTLHC